ncbi:Chromosome partition protein Smc [Carpediemonas membranifera]|uniref:Chromosome partition protein Smc n=1 Tax=Carpediemonas membranifera TaxID=201153 RepID=A0A8J6BBQ2_9EUKA|nr:Chromosome partition protein Smc [Carpediemonas membranifera]|eukprot:KAG9394047.1 Chromosome partition protein Smc [Carpediemonas membranifera]
MSRLRQISVNSSYIQVLEDRETENLQLNAELAQTKNAAETATEEAQKVRDAYLQLAAKSESVDNELHTIQLSTNEMRNQLASVERQALSLENTTTAKLREMSLQKNTEETSRNARIDDLRIRSERIEEEEIPAIESELERVTLARKELWAAIEKDRAAHQAKLLELADAIAEAEALSTSDHTALAQSLGKLDDCTEQATSKEEKLKATKTAILDKLSERVRDDLTAAASSNSSLINTLVGKVEMLMQELRSIEGRLTMDRQQGETLIRALDSKRDALAQRHIQAENKVADAEAALHDEEAKRQTLLEKIDEVKAELQETKAATSAQMEVAERNLADQIKSTRRKTGDVKERIDDITRELSAARQEVNRLDARYANIQTEMERLEAGLESDRTAAESKRAQINQSIADLTHRVGMATQESDRRRMEAAQANVGLERVNRAIAQARETVKELQEEVMRPADTSELRGYQGQLSHITHQVDAVKRDLAQAQLEFRMANEQRGPI